MWLAQVQVLYGQYPRDSGQLQQEAVGRGAEAGQVTVAAAAAVTAAPGDRGGAAPGETEAERRAERRTGVRTVSVNTPVARRAAAVLEDR